MHSHSGLAKNKGITQVPGEVGGKEAYVSCLLQTPLVRTSEHHTNTGK